LLSAGTGVLSTPWTVDEDCVLTSAIFSKAGILTKDASQVVADFSGPSVTALKYAVIAAQDINGGIVVGIKMTLYQGETINLVSAGGTAVLMYLDALTAP
jgi:hypothetical protein